MDERGAITANGRGTAGGLWAITSYFNPMGYRRRLENYRIFREHLQVPLLTVELGYGRALDLNHGDADILVQYHGNDVMWQKERLLNLALRALPRECGTVAWLDCDIIFQRNDWPEQALRLLEGHALVQLFTHADHVSRDFFGRGQTSVLFRQTSSAFAIASSNAPCAVLGRPVARGQGTTNKGLAWAAHRELLEQHGFYDACVIGGGDRAMAYAAYGCFAEFIRQNFMNPREQRQYMEWAAPFHDAVHGSVAVAHCRLFHLWHGEMRDRRSPERYEKISRFGFDPSEDLAIDDNGCWRWNTNKEAMHGYVRDYFASRREDG